VLLHFEHVNKQIRVFATRFKLTYF